ncbi:PPIC-type PPIASE domain containing protein [Trichomonas vaginalis G3]|uniref:peptidylprolyl isomerase n=1 Tax=Trichomonas vaginalis (strain ATCC PRA-98 / G3) TaxID=412133 RepID=A2EWG2_TRIV3|nr:positive regulation of chromatin silencing at rDNA [Trichomonas vaginalis G3]EAY02989.1 PPIC-type PPIASE domain containing protein [Trichomonas vaginalis G3]KAI5501761.1 positive regulation of chromatin silencing at rDNA [Trichomonas vaginalis G3]|eukprot:XP_001315212.1 PPIC-type PPIASE domain containing protein [Trichomonas vaginalis G3]
MASLPPGFEVKTLSGSRYYFRNEKEKICSWVRPAPPPGYDGPWPLIFRCSHILIKHTESNHPVSRNPNRLGRPIEKTKQEAYNIIKSLYEKIISGEKTFEEIAYIWSDDGSAENRGDLNWGAIEVYDTNFTKVAMSLKYNEISQPFLTRAGWHICKKTDGANSSYLSGGGPPFEIEFFGAPLFMFSEPIRSYIKKIKNQEIYEYYLKTETEPFNFDPWEKLIERLYTILNDIKQLDSSQNLTFLTNVIFRFIDGHLYFHPTSSDAIDFCFDYIEKIDNTRFEYYLNKVLVYTTNPKHWKKHKDRTLCLRRVGFTIDFASEWLNYIKSLTDPVDICTYLLKALSTGIEYSYDLLKLAHEQSDLSNPESALSKVSAISPDLHMITRIQERVHQIDICNVVRIFFDNDFHKKGDSYLDQVIVALTEKSHPPGVENTLRQFKEKLPGYKEDKLLQLTQEFKENKDQCKERFACEEKCRRNRRGPDNFNFKNPEMVKSENERFRAWMDYINTERTIMKQIIQDDNKFYNDLIDFSYRRALNECWWVKSVWMQYWEFLKQTGREQDSQNILELSQKTFMFDAAFELERADLLVKSGNFEAARKIYSELMKREEPVLSAAMTLDFRCVMLMSGENEALQTVSDRLDLISPNFIINAAKMCSNPDIAWSLYQHGLDTFHSTELTLAAADFMAGQRDIRNTRLLLQQSKGDESEESILKISKKLFEFELEHVAPPDHLNEIQKTIKMLYPFIPYMHRYRFRDLYPLDPDELIMTAYCTHEFSVDFPKVSKEYVTLLPPYGHSKEEMKRKVEYSEFYNDAVNDFQNQTSQQAHQQQQQLQQQGQPATPSYQPAAIAAFTQELTQDSAGYPPQVINIDELIEKIKNLTFV